MPAAYCGVYGHKPTPDLIPVRGHAPAGAEGVPPRLVVVGPLARTAADLTLALDVLAGPDTPRSTAYRLDLPAFGATPGSQTFASGGAHRAIPPRRSMVARSVGAIERTSAMLRLEALGARVERGHARLPDLAAAHAAYGALLGAEPVVGAGAAGCAKPFPAADWLALLDTQLR